MQLDKLTMNLKAYFGIFTDSKLDGAVGNVVKGMNEYFDTLYKIDKIHKENKGEYSNLNAGISTVSDSMVLLGVASMVNLKKIRGMFGAILTSIKTLNPYLILFLVGLAAIQNLNKLSIGPHMSSEEIDGIYKANEAYHERQKELAKSKEMIDKEHKALATLKTQMDTMALSDFNFKLKDINDTFKEGMKDVYGMGEALQSLTELQVKLNMPSMDKKFKENADKIKSFDRFEMKGINEEGIRQRAAEGITSSSLAKKYNSVNERSSIMRSENIWGDKIVTEQMYRESLSSKDKDIYVSKIDRITKEKKKSDEWFVSKMKEFVSLEGKRSPQNAENLKFAEYAKADKAGDEAKKNQIAEKNKWSANDLIKLTKERTKFLEQDKNIIDNQAKIKKEMGARYKEFISFGRTDADWITMTNVMQKHALEMAKNTTAEYEQRVQVLNDMTKALSEISDKISEIQLKQAESFMKLNNFKNMTDFKKGLDTVGLSAYKDLIKEFSGTINSFASQSSKMDFMNNKFMDMAGAIQSFSNAQEKLKDNIKVVGAGSAMDSMGNKTNLTISQLYGRLSRMKGGIGGVEAAKEMNKYNSDTLGVLNKINEAYGEIGEIDKLKAMEKTNARIQEKSLVQVEKYNSSIDSQLLSLGKINASKMESLKIDRDMAKLQYDLAKNKQSEVVTETTSKAMNDFIDLRKKEKKGKVEFFTEGDVLDLKKLPSYTTVVGNKNITEKTALQKALGNNTTLDFGNLESLTKFIDIAKDLKNDSAIITKGEQKLIDYANAVRTELLKGKEAEVKYAEDLMIYEKGSYEAFHSYFAEYLDYISKSGQEVKVMEHKKAMLENMAKNAMIDNKETEESISLKIQAFKIQDDINEKSIESAEKLFSINAEIEKYSIKRQMYFGSDLQALQLEYDFNKKNLKVELDRLEAQKKSFKENFTSPKLIKDNIDIIKGKLSENKESQSKLISSTDEKDKIRLTGLKEQELNYTSEQSMLEELISMSVSDREKALNNNVKYREILAKLSKAEFDNNELDINNWKEKLKIEYELRDIAYDMKTIQSETERETSRNLYKEVFGSQTFNESESKANIDKAKQVETTAEDKLLDYREEYFESLKSSEDYINASPEKKSKMLQDSNKSLSESVEYRNLEKSALEAGYNLVKATNEEELKRIQYLRQQVESVLDMVDAISKGEGFKFDASSAIKGASGAFTKIYANSQEKDPSKKQKVTPKDYADIAMAGVGLATNIIGQTYDSQMNVINAELSNLELRKQLARTEEEKQQIDLEILEKQKQQIDLEYQKSTQTMGVTGTAGSALGGVMSGANAGSAIAPGIGTAIGAVLGGVGGYIAGVTGKKQAEQQKESLMYQAKIAEYVENMNENIKANNSLMEIMVSQGTKVGVVSAKEKALTNVINSRDETLGGHGTSNWNDRHWSEHIWDNGKWKDDWKLQTANYNLESFGYKEEDIKNANTLKELQSKVKAQKLEQLKGIAGKDGSGKELSGNAFFNLIQTQGLERAQKTLGITVENFMKTYQQTQGSQAQHVANFNALSDFENQLNGVLDIYNTLAPQIYQAYMGATLEPIKDVNDVITGYTTDWTDYLADKLSTAYNDILSNTSITANSLTSTLFSGINNMYIQNYSDMNTILKASTDIFTTLSNTMSKSMTDFNFNTVSESMKSLISLSSKYKEEQQQINDTAEKFVEMWVNNGGDIIDILDSLPAITKTLQSAMQNSFGNTDYVERFNSIGSALKSTIETKLNEVSFTKLQNQFIATNTSLSALMSGDLTMNNMAQLSQGIAKYTAQAEQSAYKTKAMLDMLQLDQTVDYGVSNTQVEYKTGSTNTNVYNFTNNVTTTIGNLLGDARAMQNFTDSIVGYMVESMQKQGVLKK